MDDEAELFMFEIEQDPLAAITEPLPVAITLMTRTLLALALLTGVPASRPPVLR
jgi:hypothetical protein